MAAKQKKTPLRRISPVSLNAREGFGRTLTVPPKWTAEQWQNLQAKFVTVNPPKPGTPSRNIPGPSSKPALGGEQYPALNAQGSTRPLWGSGAEPLLSNPVVKNTATNAILATMPVAQGTDGDGHTLTSTVGEPSVSGVPGALLYTGNWHAALSDTDGLSWQYLDPQNMFPEDAGTASSDNGMCCDQIAFSERSTSSKALTVWLGQSNNVSASDGNRLRLLVYQGPGELMEQRGYCSVDITPQGAGYDASTMYDFNQISRTKKWLYVTTNVYDLSPDDASDTDTDPQKTGREARIYRINWDDLKAGDCSPQVQSGVPTGGFTVSPAQGSDDKSTMYMATQTSLTNSSGDDLGNGLIIYKIKDSENSFGRFYVDLKNWPDATRGNLKCSLPDGTDACLRSDDRITTGFRVDSRAGWFWNVPQGSGFDYPHIRGAVINTDTEELSFEPDIWSNDNAWIYPAVQVNSSGQVGMTAYKAGGGDYTRARSFLIKSPKSSPSWSGMQSQGIVSSSYGVKRNVWGDYSTITAYPGCSKTFASAVWSMADGNNDGNSQHRFAWFGETGCANLKTELVVYLPYAVKAGEEVAVGSTIRNSGSASAGSSKSYLYLSSDINKDSGDKYLGTISHSSLSSGSSQAKSNTFTIPSSTRAGSYYLISCADGGGSVSETSEDDNCSASETMLSVARDPIRLPAASYQANLKEMAESSGRNHPLVEQSIISRDIASLIKLQPVIETYVSLKPVFSSKALLLLKQIPRPPKPIPTQGEPGQGQEPNFKVLKDGTYELPLDKANLDLSKLKVGRYFVFSCLRSASSKTKPSDCVGIGQVNRVGFLKAKKPGQ